MPFFEDIGKKISNMGQTAVEKPNVPQKPFA